MPHQLKKVADLPLFTKQIRKCWRKRKNIRNTLPTKNLFGRRNGVRRMKRKNKNEKKKPTKKIKLTKLK